MAFVPNGMGAEEDIMAVVKNQRSALWALAAAGGLWAWQNRDKIQGYIKNSGVLDQINGAMQNAGNSSSTSHRRPMESFDPTPNMPMTGETRRMTDSDLESFTNETKTKYDPAI